MFRGPVYCICSQYVSWNVRVETVKTNDALSSSPVNTWQHSSVVLTCPPAIGPSGPPGPPVPSGPACAAGLSCVSTVLTYSCSSSLACLTSSLLSRDPCSVSWSFCTLLSGKSKAEASCARGMSTKVWEEEGCF